MAVNILCSNSRHFLNSSQWGYETKYFLFCLKCVLSTNGLPTWVGKLAYVYAAEHLRSMSLVWRAENTDLNWFPSFLSDIWDCLLSPFYLKEIFDKGANDVSFCVDMFSVLLGKYPGVELESPMSILCLTFSGTARLFSKALAPFYIPICSV